jgi:hypothetical protein
VRLRVIIIEGGIGGPCPAQGGPPFAKENPDMKMGIYVSRAASSYLN